MQVPNRAEHTSSVWVPCPFWYWLVSKDWSPVEICCSLGLYMFIYFWNRSVCWREMFSHPAPAILLWTWGRVPGSVWKFFETRGHHPAFEPTFWTSTELYRGCTNSFFGFRKQCDSQSKHSLDWISWENVEKALFSLFSATRSQERERAFSNVHWETSRSWTSQATS